MALDPFDPLTSLKQQFYCNIQERNFSHKFDKKNCLQIRLHINTLLFWVLILFGSLQPIVLETTRGDDNISHDPLGQVS